MPAKSKFQQRLFGIALAVKRGEMKRSEVNKDILDIVDNMSEKDIEDSILLRILQKPNINR